jgi:hypothetical protein
MYRGLSAAVVEASDAKMPACKAALRSAGGELLRRAQQAGTVRADATIADLLRLTYAFVLVAEKNPEDKGLFERLMSFTVDGLRTPTTAPV